MITVVSGSLQAGSFGVESSSEDSVAVKLANAGVTEFRHLIKSPWWMPVIFRGFDLSTRQSKIKAAKIFYASSNAVAALLLYAALAPKFWQASGFSFVMQFLQFLLSPLVNAPQVFIPTIDAFSVIEDIAKLRITSYKDYTFARFIAKSVFVFAGSLFYAALASKTQATMANDSSWGDWFAHLNLWFLVAFFPNVFTAIMPIIDKIVMNVLKFLSPNLYYAHRYDQADEAINLHFDGLALLVRKDPEFARIHYNNLVAPTLKGEAPRREDVLKFLSADTPLPSWWVKSIGLVLGVVVNTIPNWMGDLAPFKQAIQTFPQLKSGFLSGFTNMLFTGYYATMELIEACVNFLPYIGQYVRKNPIIFSSLSLLVVGVGAFTSAPTLTVLGANFQALRDCLLYVLGCVIGVAIINTLFLAMVAIDYNHRRAVSHLAKRDDVHAPLVEGSELTEKQYAAFCRYNNTIKEQRGAMSAEEFFVALIKESDSGYFGESSLKSNAFSRVLRAQYHVGLSYEDFTKENPHTSGTNLDVFRVNYLKKGGMSFARAWACLAQCLSVAVASFWVVKKGLAFDHRNPVLLWLGCVLLQPLMIGLDNLFTRGKYLRTHSVSEASCGCFFKAAQDVVWAVAKAPIAYLALWAGETVLSGLLELDNLFGVSKEAFSLNFAAGVVAMLSLVGLWFAHEARLDKEREPGILPRVFC